MCDFNLETGAITTLSEFETGRNTRPNDGRTDKDGNFVIGSYNNNHRGDAKEIGGRTDATNKNK
jgi:sugar lactone lactonase YvrE